MLEQISQHHDEWVAMAKNLGGGDLCEDIVQDAYLRIHKYKETVKGKIINDKGIVNRFYMFSIVRNTLKTALKKEGEYVSFSDFYYEEAREDFSLEYEKAYQNLMNNINNYVNSLGKYKSMLFNLYYKTDFSLRNISARSGIGLTHIHNTTRDMKLEVFKRFEDEFKKLKEF